MAKKEYNPYVTALIDIKPIISQLKNTYSLATIDASGKFIYVVPIIDLGDTIIEITDEKIIPSTQFLANRLIGVPSAVAFNKALKKTKTEVTHNEDKSITYSTPDYDVTLTLNLLENNNLIAKNYHLICKDKDFTVNMMNTVHSDITEWTFLSDTEMDDLKKNRLTVIESSTGNKMYIARPAFGNIKKTINISHHVLSTDDYSEVVIFRQIEPQYNTYKIFRFLKWCRNLSI